MRVLVYLLFVLMIMPAVFLAPATAQNPGYTAYPGFGDYTNSRPAPTTGTLTGRYLTRGAWTQTGAITCNRCSLKFGSTR